MIEPARESDASADVGHVGAIPGGPRVAIAHDYLTQRGGAEKVVLSMSRAFPDAPIYTTLYDPAGTYPEFAERDVRVSALNRVGPLRRNHRAALPLLAFAASSMFVDADVVVTSSSGWAHGFRTNGRKLVHCHSPARWLYLPEQYLGERPNPLKRAALAAGTRPLRRWDRRAARSCDRYLAISKVVQQRIADVYGIAADIVPSPVAPVDDIAGEPVEQITAAMTEGFYLCISRLLPYKNVDRVIAAFAGSDRQLVVVGRGPEAGRLAHLKTDNVVMVSDLTDAQMAWLYRRCRAVVAASYEDFGLTPIEAGMRGKPSVVLRWGGYLDTVAEDVSGIFFDAPEPGAIAAALDRFERMTWHPERIREHMDQFTEPHFAKRLRSAVAELASA